jgi:hypothetical protein
MWRRDVETAEHSSERPSPFLRPNLARAPVSTSTPRVPGIGSATLVRRARELSKRDTDEPFATWSRNSPFFGPNCARRADRSIGESGATQNLFWLRGDPFRRPSLSRFIDLLLTPLTLRGSSMHPSSQSASVVAALTSSNSRHFRARSTEGLLGGRRKSGRSQKILWGEWMRLVQSSAFRVRF